MSPPAPEKVPAPIAVFWSKSRTILLTTVAVTIAVLGIRYVGGLQPSELWMYDQFIRMKTDEDPDSRVLLVEITEEDIRNENGYPISDRTLAKALKILEQQEPRSIGLDIIRDVPIKEGRAELLQYFEQSQRIIAVCKIEDEGDPGFPPPEKIPEEAIGFANLAIDPGGIVRRALLTIEPPTPVAQPNHACEDPTAPLPSLGLSVALQYLEAEGIAPDPDSEDLKLNNTVFKTLPPNAGSYQHADVGGYQVLLNYRSAKSPVNQVSLTDVLRGKVDPSLIKDRAVLVGYVARSVKDELFTPYSTGGRSNNQPMPGVVIHAQVVSQVLSAALDNRPLIWYWPEAVEALWILGWALVGGVLAWRIQRPTYLLLAIAGTSTGVGGLCFLLFTQAGWVPVVPPILALILTSSGIVFFSKGYAQAIYKGVRGWLKLDVEIDETRKEEELAEITKSEYFQELEKKAQQKRQQKVDPNQMASSMSDPSMPNPSTADATTSAHSSAPVSGDRFASLQSTEGAELDYLDQLQRRGKTMRRKPQPIEQVEELGALTLESTTPNTTPQADEVGPPVLPTYWSESQPPSELTDEQAIADLLKLQTELAEIQAIAAEMEHHDLLIRPFAGANQDVPLVNGTEHDRFPAPPDLAPVFPEEVLIPPLPEVPPLPEMSSAPTERTIVPPIPSATMMPAATAVVVETTEPVPSPDLATMPIATQSPVIPPTKLETLSTTSPVSTSVISPDTSSGSGFDFLPPVPKQPRQQAPKDMALAQLIAEVDDYYHQLKQQREKN